MRWRSIGLWLASGFACGLVAGALSGVAAALAGTKPGRSLPEALLGGFIAAAGAALRFQLVALPAFAATVVAWALAARRDPALERSRASVTLGLAVVAAFCIAGVWLRAPSDPGLGVLVALIVPSALIAPRWLVPGLCPGALLAPPPLPRAPLPRPPLYERLGAGRSEGRVHYRIGDDVVRIATFVHPLDAPAERIPPSLRAPGSRVILDVADDGSLESIEEIPALVLAAERDAVAELRRQLRERSDPLLARDLADAFYAAVAYGHLASAKLLRAAGAPIDARPSFGWSDGTLFRAIDNHDAEMLEFLLDQGAALDARTGGYPLLHAAIDAEMIEWTELYRGERPLSARLTELLLERGADDTLCDDDGRDALEFARWRGHELAENVIARRRGERRGAPPDRGE